MKYTSPHPYSKNSFTQRILGWTDRHPGLFSRVIRFYTEGFSEMTVGRTLWTLIIIKLFILFAVFRLFLFPDVLSRDYDNDEDRATAVRRHLSRPRTLTLPSAIIPTISPI